MHRAIKKADAGLHLKTAGTTWLEEVIGLASAGGEGLAFAKALYRDAYGRFDEMAKPYLTVIAIDRGALPTPDQVDLALLRYNRTSIESHVSKNILKRHIEPLFLGTSA